MEFKEDIDEEQRNMIELINRNQTKDVKIFSANEKEARIRLLYNIIMQIPESQELLGDLEKIYEIISSVDNDSDVVQTLKENEFPEYIFSLLNESNSQILNVVLGIFNQMLRFTNCISRNDIPYAELKNGFMHPECFPNLCNVYSSLVRTYNDIAIELITEGGIFETIHDIIPRLPEPNLAPMFFNLITCILLRLTYEQKQATNNENTALIDYFLPYVFDYLNSNNISTLYSVIECYFVIIQNSQRTLEYLIPNEIIQLLIKLSNLPHEIDPDEAIFNILLKIWNFLIIQSDTADNDMFNYLVKMLFEKLEEMKQSKTIKKILIIFKKIANNERLCKLFVDSSLFESILVDKFPKSKFEFKAHFLSIFCEVSYYFPQFVVNLDSFDNFLLDAMDVMEYLSQSDRKLTKAFLTALYSLFVADNDKVEVIDREELYEFLSRFSDLVDDIGDMARKILVDFEPNESGDEDNDPIFN